MVILVWVVGYQQARYKEGLSLGRAAEVILGLGGENDDVRAQLFNNLGVVLWKRADYEKAREYLSKSLEIREQTLGSEHPLVAYTLNNLGVLCWSKAEYSKALEYLSKSLAIRETTLAPGHPLLALPLSAIGNVFVDQGRSEKSLEPFERVVHLCEKKICDPDPYGRGLFGLARALVATDGDKRRAIVLGKKAKEVFGKTPKMFKKELEEVSLGLKKQVVE